MEVKKLALQVGGGGKLLLLLQVDFTPTVVAQVPKLQRLPSFLFHFPCYVAYVLYPFFTKIFPGKGQLYLTEGNGAR